MLTEQFSKLPGTLILPCPMASGPLHTHGHHSDLGWHITFLGKGLQSRDTSSYFSSSKPCGICPPPSQSPGSFLLL